MSSKSSSKRKRAIPTPNSPLQKKRRLDEEPGPSAPTPPVTKPNGGADTSIADASKPTSKVKHKPPKQTKEPRKTDGKNKNTPIADSSRPTARPSIIKLAPPRPFPSVPTSSNATGPYSARAEGKNMICVTRKTELGAYLRRCSELVREDGYRTIHLHALGAAIPHALLLAHSLPDILPFPQGEVETKICTGTVKCIDEIVPSVEDEELVEGELKSREKSCVEVVVKIGDGERLDGPARKLGRDASKGHPKAIERTERPSKDVIMAE